MVNHTCHAYGCKTPVPPRRFMCRGHWRALPKDLQDAIWREYRPGQEVDKKPSARYMAVQRLAIYALAPNDQIAVRYWNDAQVWRGRALAAGEGDVFDDMPTRRSFPMTKKSKKVASKVASKPAKVKAVAKAAKSTKAPVKRKTACGTCGESGHNARTCKAKKSSKK